MAGIYIHIPFCKQACYYCDFHFSTAQETKPELVNAIATELVLQRKYLNNEVVQTLYLGGGTPSLLTAQELKILFETIRSHFDIAPNAEITIEANPDDLTYEKLKLLRETGVNRLSIGIQSFDDSVLQFLNRAHHAQAAMDCVKVARSAGFENISIDLIYAIPHQDETLWQRNIEKAIALAPEHISSYSLTIEEKTVFGSWSSKGKLQAVPDDDAAAQLEILVDMLGKAGYEQYEVSNFALPGFHSRHNSSYWKQQKYLGVGPSAHSYNGVSRQYNVANNHLYLRALKEGKVPCTIEPLSRFDMINDYLLTTLRTRWGADLSFVKEVYGHDVISAQGAYIDSLEDRDLAVLKDNVLTLTARGKLFADKISSDLFVLK